MSRSKIVLEQGNQYYCIRPYEPSKKGSINLEILILGVGVGVRVGVRGQR